MQFNDVKTLLTETSTSLRKQGVDMVADYPSILAEESLFDFYTDALSEGLEAGIREEFKKMSGLVREGLLSETVYGFKPQAQMVLPVFRKMWPQLVAREALTVIPMEKPEIVYPFMIAYAKLANGSEIALPNNTTAISNGIEIGTVTPMDVSVPASVDVLAANGLTSSNAHLQRDFVIANVTYLDDSSATVVADLYLEPDEEGHFSFTFDCGTYEDTVSGFIDFFKGTITVSSIRSAETSSKVTKVGFVGSISQAEEMYAPKIELKHTKIHLNAVDHEVQAEWSIQYEQDVKAYFDLAVQAQLVDTFGNVVAMDIDRKLINRLLADTQRFHSSAVKTFHTTPETGYAFGKKEWLDQITLTMNEVSNQIYVDTNIGVANVVIGNPLDVALLKSTGSYSFKGTTTGGEFGDSPVAGTFNDSWKVLSTPIIPRGKMLMLHKPQNPDNAVFVFAPYRPLTITPWPLGRKPAMSFLSRYAAQFIRREGVGLINIVA